MLRMILASLAAVAGGTIGGLTLFAALPVKDFASQASAIADPSPKEPAPTPVAAPKRAAATAPPPAQAAPAPAAPTPPAPSPKTTPADATPDSQPFISTVSG